MSLAKIVHAGVNGDQTYSIPFPFLEQTHLWVLVDGDQKDLTTDFTVNSAGTILTFTGTTPITGGEVIVIRRQTPKLEAQQLVQFANGSTLTAENLTTFSRQLLYVIQEAFDAAEDALPLTDDGSLVWDALGRRITDLADAVDDGDAVNVRSMLNIMLSEGTLPPASALINDYMIAVVDGEWTLRTPSQARTNLGLGTAALATTGTAAGNVPVLDGSARYPAVDGRNLSLGANALMNALYAVPTLKVSFADTALANTASGTWLTDTSGTVGRLNMSGSGEMHDAGGYFSVDEGNDLFTLQAGRYQIEINAFIANTAGANSGAVDLVLSNSSGTIPVFTFAPQTFGPAAGGATHGDGMAYRHTLLEVNVVTTLTLALKARNNAGAGAVVAYGDGTEIIVRRTGVAGGP